MLNALGPSFERKFKAGRIEVIEVPITRNLVIGNCGWLILIELLRLTGLARD